MKRIEKNLLLASVLLAGGTGSFAYVWVSHGRDDHGAQADEERRLFRFQPEEVEGAILRARGATIAFARDPGSGWRITSPIEAPGDGDAIGQAIDRMASLRGDLVEPGPATPEVLERYELAHPKTSIEVRTKRGSFRLLVGPKHPMDERYFVTRGDGRSLFLADGAFYLALDRSLDGFRDRHPIPIAPNTIASVAVERSGELRFRLDRSDASWQVTDGASVTLPADEGETNLFLVAITSRLRAEAFITDHLTSRGAEDLAHYGLERPDYALRIQTTSKTTTRALIGSFRETAADKATTVLHIEGTASVIAVPSWIRVELDRTIEVLRDRTISRFERDQAQSIDLTLASGESITVKRKPKKASSPSIGEGGGDAEWIIDPGDRPVESWIINRLLLTASRLKANRVEKEAASKEDLAAWMLDPPRSRLIFRRAGGEVLADVRIGKRITENEVAVMRSGTTRVGAYSKTLDEILPASAAGIVSIAAERREEGAR